MEKRKGIGRFHEENFMLVAGAEPAVRWRGAGGYEESAPMAGPVETPITYTVPETPSEFTVLIPPSVSILQGQTSTTMEISIAGIPPWRG